MSTSLKFAHTDSSNRGQMVIQCPSCLTRFAVEAAAIEAVDNPHFHCSKCDHLFGFEEEFEPKAAEPAPKAEQIQKPETELTDGVVAVYRNSAKVQPITRAVENPKPLEIPRRWDSNLKSAAPRETTPEPPQMPLNFAAPASPSATLAKSEEIKSPSSEVEDTIEIESLGPIKNTPLVEDGSSVRSAAPAVAPQAAKAPILPRTLSPLREPRKATVWSHLAAPVVAFFAALILIAVALRMSDSFSQTVVQKLLPGAMEAAPSGLYIRNTKFQKITLDSGEVVRVISGTIVNNAEVTFRDVELEGALFDSSGKTLGAIRADAAATLAKTKVRSLTPEMIQDLQSGKNAKRMILHPGEDKEFSLALIGTEYAGAKHFGARIYSAKQL